MAVTKGDKKSALAVLTSAALALPGLQAEAAVPIAQPEANVQYGYYQESDDRMEIDVYHADFIVPLSDRIEFSFSVDRDTYSGATPVYSVPNVTSTDVVSAASGSTDPFEMVSPYLNTCDPADLRCKEDASPEERESNAYYFGLSVDVEEEYVLNKVEEFGGGLTGKIAYGVWVSNPVNQKKQAVAIDSGVMDILLNQPVTASTKSQQVLTHQPVETRIMPIFSTNVYFNDVTLGLSGGLSDEPDFISKFGSARVNWELNNKLTTLSAGYGYTDNEIFRSAPSVDDSEVHNHGAVTSDFAKTSVFNNFNLGGSQVISKNTLIQLDGSYTHQKGYLSNPYKFVNIRGEISGTEYSAAGVAEDLVTDWSFATDLEVAGIDLFYEVRPELRSQWSFSARLNQYIPAVDAAVHLDYRYYFDDWDIDSHTLELTWYQSLPRGWSLTPSIRYYSQSQADFFAPYFLAPRADGNYSSDYRLSSFGAISGGLTISKQFVKGIKLDAGFEYYVRESDLAIRGDIDTTYADYDFYMVHANLNVNLGVVGREIDEHHGHHKHHSAPVPAGVMFAHMMPKAGDFMVGYNYAYANQYGSMFHGSNEVSDASLLYTACGQAECTARPSEMRMDMHMLNLMYAPTDWLNLMLMPQIMDMRMSLEDVPGASKENEHGSGHDSGGLGDTVMAALVKVYDAGGHHVHVGLGVSAPTGDVDITLDGLDKPDSFVQDYGMQVGSGTWDLIPSLTYTGEHNKWSWGAQLSGIKRMEDRNESGYALGDVFNSTLWGGYKMSNWLSASVRGKYTDQGSIKGAYNRPHLDSTPVDNTDNYGGQLWDVGVGLNATAAGHQFEVEWLEPVADDFNGYQLEREGTLSVNWSFMF